MRRWGIVIVVILLLSGCNEEYTNVEIEWVDFVKLNENSYTSLDQNVITNPKDVTDQVVGEVKFKVAGVIRDTNYKSKSGDAAFLDIGTKLYRVRGFEPHEIIAAKDKRKIGGYRLYVDDDYAEKIPRHYKDVPKDRIKRIEIYHWNKTQPFITLNGTKKERFINLLENGKDVEDYRPQNQNGDPKYYQMVLYTDQPLGHTFALFDDGFHVYFNPWYTRIVNDHIRNLLIEP